MQVKTNLKSGALTTNHNQTLVVRTGIKAGGVNVNHNQTVVR